MLEQKRITLESKSVFETYFKNMNNSTYNFTNMFMWSGEKSITYAETFDCLVLFFQFGKNPPMASYPIGSGDKKAAVISVCEYLKERGVRPVFRNLSDWMKDELSELFPGSFEFIYDRDNSDYIYETKQMIELSGKKLHGKKNHFNYFCNTYPHEYVRLTMSDMPACKELFGRWMNNSDDSNAENAKAATLRVMDNLENLNITAGGILVDGTLVAASFAEPVSEDTVLVHLEFADQSYRGVYPAMSQRFCQNEWSNYKYVNREEDMGLSGLRQAKLAYRPAYILDKYAAVWNQ